jgi:hypothetical protein
MSIVLRALFRFLVRCGPGLFLCWIGELLAMSSGTLAALNLRTVNGKSLALKKLRLTRPERLALMIHGRLLHGACADHSSFQLHGGVCDPLIVQRQF